MPLTIEERKQRARARAKRRYAAIRHERLEQIKSYQRARQGENERALKDAIDALEMVKHCLVQFLPKSKCVSA